MVWQPLPAALLAAAMTIGIARAQGDSSAPYVPTPHDVVEKMLRMARVGAGDYVIDLGSGDGRIVITAAKRFGARGVGVDINAKLIAESEGNARKAGVSERVALYGARMQSRFAWDAARGGAHAESTQSPGLARIQ